MADWTEEQLREIEHRRSLYADGEQAEIRDKLIAWLRAERQRAEAAELAEATAHKDRAVVLTLLEKMELERDAERREVKRYKDENADLEAELNATAEGVADGVAIHAANLTRIEELGAENARLASAVEAITATLQ